MNKAILYPLPLIVILLLTSCATRPDTIGQSTGIASGHGVATGEQQYWWYARFKIAWPDNTEPDFSVDLLLADAVIKPVLHEQRHKIGYWRFHRRAVRDSAGHQFSFIFYSDRGTADTVYQSIQGDQIVAQLKQDKVLQDIIFDNPDKNTRTDIGDTSDKNWSPEIRTAWPAYIMGVSSMWLQLIEQKTGSQSQVADTKSLLEKYRTANRKITELWQTEGQHALLHHLNAIFGYEPMIIKKAIQF